VNFNKYLWNLYATSPEGKEAIGKDITSFSSTGSQEKIPFHYSLFFQEYAVEEIVQNQNQANKLFIDIVDEGTTFELEDEDGKDFVVFYGGALEYPDFSEKEAVDK
jgi:hypothetical protein